MNIVLRRCEGCGEDITLEDALHAEGDECPFCFTNPKAKEDAQADLQNHKIVNSNENLELWKF